MNKEINGINISYETYGLLNKKVIFLLHGWGSNKESFLGVAKNLSKSYKVIIPDFPGMGKSDEPKKPFFVKNYVDILILFIESFKVNECDLLGHSFGGRLIIKLLGEKLNKNFKVNKVVLVDSAGIKPKKTLRGIIGILRFKFYKNIVKIFANKKYKDSLIEELRQTFGSSDYKNASEIMRQTLRNVINEDLTKHLSKIQNETLIIWGENDLDTPLSDGKKMNSLIENSGIVVLKDASHYSFIDKSFEFNKILGNFLV